MVLVDDDTSRAWLRAQWTKCWDAAGFSLAPHWHESAEKVRIYTRRPVSTLLGLLSIRFVEALPEPVLSVEVGGVVVPVLPLALVRQAHEGQAELLDRHEHRLAGAAARRTV